MNRKLDSETAAIINLVRTCQAFNALPLPGGLFDQDAYFVYCAQIVLAADAERANREQKKGG